MFAGIPKRAKSAAPRPTSLDDATIRQKCETELTAYLFGVCQDLMDKNGKYSNPLEWWEKYESNYPILARLAVAVVFLAIPATSAPSERIWSRAAGVLTTKRANLDPEVASGMMFVKENLEVLRKHYTTLTEKDVNALSLELSGLPLPPTDWKDLDVGQDVFDLEF